MSRRRKKFSKPNATVEIETLSHDGRGIARVEGKTVFVSRALPGETVEISYTLSKKNFDEANVVKVIVASEKRATPPCDSFDQCGGCSVQHISPQDQIEMKQNHLMDLLKNIGKTKPDSILPPLQAETSGYRRKARLGVRFVEKKEKVLVGFRERNGRYLADIDSCKVLVPQVGERIKELGDLIHTLEAYNTIAQIEVAAGDEEIALVFRNLKELSDSDREKLCAFGKQYDFQIWLQPKGPDTVHNIFPGGVEYLHYAVPEFETRYEFRPIDFTQVNAGINQKMIARAVSLLELNEQDHVLDLFCGLGNFTLPLARCAKSVVGVEGDQGLVDLARKNGKQNNIDNVEFYFCNLFEDFSGLNWARERYNKILIDPPRSGALEVAKNLKRLSPERLVYISCDPATLARDAEEIVHRQGYRLVQAGVMDMFPHTTHVESIAVFERP
ncbi:MAG: 23S rRNA (uracil(1939)-C(5))-methyltransferase RlmD [Gammaproteobacteria bacterium]|nr:23S rRNA (uracil(1939)-C(5))-methyltransferase RlmD [Gammaproteobacteria bacterium]MDH5693602.1 23S rRNA (uracil(1939)-C(5))-methyltransferase RlmD [Gammaproteobacteria bacterium]